MNSARRPTRLPLPSRSPRRIPVCSCGCLGLRSYQWDLLGNDVATAIPFGVYAQGCCRTPLKARRSCTQLHLDGSPFVRNLCLTYRTNNGQVLIVGDRVQQSDQRGEDFRLIPSLFGGNLCANSPGKRSFFSPPDHRQGETSSRLGHAVPSAYPGQ